jgi:ABC-type lipoprotein export system ATPase subunit
MKIKYLNIDSYRHLKNIQFDFTYPKGHIKQHQPLDKICLIGQSASGKTSVLELINEMSSNLHNDPIELLHDSTKKEAFLYKHRSHPFDVQIHYNFDNQNLILDNNNVTFNGHIYPRSSGSGSGAVDRLIDKPIRLIYFTSETISRESIEALNFIPDETKSYKDGQKQNSFDYVYKFSENISDNVWDSLLEKIFEYRKSLTQLASELIHKGVNVTPDKLSLSIEEWSKKNTDPLKPFAEIFNPILSTLGLEIELSNTKYPIPVKSKISGEIVPFKSLSTGTKSLLLSLYPLFALDTKDALILLDEPERSLFPDIQVELMSYYQNLAKEAQFVVATHSPFIAAAFEPYERFILYFNTEGKVSVRSGRSPIGDDPNDILSNDFMIDYYNEAGKNAYAEYLKIKKGVATEVDAEKKKKLIVQLAELGDKYNF